MGKPKKKHKKAKQLPLSKEEQIFQAARDNVIISNLQLTK